MALSDSTSTATVGLLNGQGLNLTGTTTLLSQLAAAPVLSQGIAAVSASADKILGHTTLPGLTGVVPATITNIGTGLGIPFYNTQTTLLTNTNNNTGFLLNLSQIYGYCSLSSSIAIEMMNSLNLNTIGIKSNKNTVAYTVTAGLSTLLTTPTQHNIASLSTDLSNTGTLYDLTDLTNLGLPGKIYSALLTANIPGALNAQASLVSAGVDLTNLTDPIAQNTILRALTNITAASDISAIVAAFGMKQQTFTNASSLTNLASVFILSASLMTVSTFTNLGIELQAINLSPTYLTFIDLGNFLNTITYPSNFNTVSTTNFSVTPDTLYSYVSTVGIGSAIGGTVSVSDFMKVLDPTNLSVLVNTQITNLTSLSNTTAGQNLITLFNNLIIAPPLSQPAIEASIEAALLALLTGTTLASQYAIAANNAWIAIMSMLSISLQAVSTSGVSLPSSPINNKTAILGVVQNLSSFGTDPNNLGTGKLLVNLSTSDVYGAAIQSSINLTPQ